MNCVYKEHEVKKNGTGAMTTAESEIFTGWIDLGGFFLVEGGMSKFSASGGTPPSPLSGKNLRDQEGKKPGEEHSSMRCQIDNNKLAVRSYLLQRKSIGKNLLLLSPMDQPSL